jgi:hypothetical protein
VKRGPAPKPADRRQGHRKGGRAFLPPEPEQDLEVDDRPDPTGEMLARWVKDRSSDRGR